MKVAGFSFRSKISPNPSAALQSSFPEHLVRSLMSGPEMTSAQLLQQVALLQWLNSDTEEDRGILAAVTGVRVGRELLNRITGRDRVDAYKRECILGISEFVRQNPGASQDQLSAEVTKRVVLFAAQVKALEATPLL